MSANATGTPTTNFSLPTFNTSVDNPNGIGVNEMMAAIDSTLVGITSASAKGDIWYAASSTSVARLPIGSTNNVLTVASGLPSWGSGQSPGSNGQIYATVAGSAGWFTKAVCGVQGFSTLPSTTSGTVVMGGMGSSCSITPTVTGNIFFDIRGTVYIAQSGSDAAEIGAYYGTGSHPTGGAGVTGTVIGQLWTYLETATGFSNPNEAFAAGGLITGLTVGTTYWFDLGYCNVSGGTTVTPTWINGSAWEV